MPSKRNKKKQSTHQTSGTEQDGRDARAPIRRWLMVLFCGVLGASLLILIWILIVPPPKDPSDSELSDSNASHVSAGQMESPPSNSLTSPRPNPQTSNSGKLKLPTAEDRLTTEQLQSALEALAESLSKEFPQDSKAHHVAAMIYAELRQTKRALNSWENCLAISRSEVGPVLGMSKILLDQGEEDRGIALMEELQKSSNDKLTVDFFQQLSDAYSQIGEIEKAEKIAGEGLNRFPKDAGLHRVSGLAKMQMQQLEQAEQSLKQAVALGDRSPSTRNTLRGLLLRQGKADEAKQFDEPKSISDGSRADQHVNASDPGDTTFQSTYREALQRIALSLLHSSCAIAIANGKAELAEIWALSAIAESPLSPAPYMDLATALRAQRRLFDAYIVHQKLVEVQPDNPYNDLNLASVAAELGELHRAEQILTQGAAKFPRVAAFYGELAKISLNRSDFAKAQRLALQASELEPQNVDWLIVLAVIAKNSGKNESFQELLDRANRLSPGDIRLKNLSQQQF